MTEPIREFIDTLLKDRSIGPSIGACRYVPPESATFRDIGMNEKIGEALASRGIGRLYSHQADAVDLIRAGHNAVVMTPTASGKSLIYNIPVIEAIMENPETRALYVFPLKGLEQDQVRHLNSLLTDCLGPAEILKRGMSLERAEVYDGDTTPHRRRKIRENMPNVIFTNPDMIHLALNAFHGKWEHFFSNLRFVVIDEIHTYRGVFGSNVCHVLRRLRRICRYWGSSPQFIACSATIANPGELAETLTGLPFKVIDRAGSPRSGRHFLFVSPSDSAYTEATRIFLSAMKRGFRTILFTKARKITELIYRWSIQREPSLAGRISPYRAGFLPEERREIERRLFSGDLLGVISTSALELGVDIGGLDVCILCGYPGSVSSTWQRSGRVGRRGRESLVALIGLKDALDAYFVTHPDELLRRDHEASVCDPENRRILRKHLICAADEIPLAPDDPVYGGASVNEIARELVAEGRLRQGKGGTALYSRERRPQRGTEIRGIGRPLVMLDEQGRQIGSLDGRRIYREAFPGAIYLHRGKEYEVIKLDLAAWEARCRQVDAAYYTQALSNEHVEITGEPVPSGSLHRGNVKISRGTLRITYRVIGFDRKHLFQGNRVSTHTVEMPEYIFDTEGIWMVIPKSFINAIVKAGHDLTGTLHAAEHVMISCIPLFALCDKGDIGGMSYPLHPGFACPAIFMYDGYEGGIGLTRRVLGVLREWIQSSVGVIEGCKCEEGCPSCVQDPQCGSGNRPLDKQGALLFLRRLLE